MKTTTVTARNTGTRGEIGRKDRACPEFVCLFVFICLLQRSATKIKPNSYPLFHQCIHNIYMEDVDNPMRMLITPIRMLTTHKLNNILRNRGKIVEVHMPFDLGHGVAQPIQILIEYKQSEMVSVSCNSALIDHFLAK